MTEIFANSPKQFPLNNEKKGVIYKMRKLIVFEVTFCILVCSTTLIGLSQDFRFIPGDSYFESELTHDLISAAGSHPEAEPILMEYIRTYPGDESAGYVNLEIKAVSRRRRELLAAIYSRIRKAQPPIFEIKKHENTEIRRELNGMNVLIYNKEFDFKRFNLGLRYNEDFFDEAHKLYFTIVGTVPFYMNKKSLKSFIVEDWRNSKQVPSLKVTLPTFPGRYPWELQYTPMTAESRDIVFIIIQRGFLKRARKKDEMVVIYVVGEQGNRI